MIKFIVPILKSEGYTFVRVDSVPAIASALPCDPSCASCTGPRLDQCTSCATANQYLAGGECKPCSPCAVGTALLVACTATADAQCGDCALGTELSADRGACVPCASGGCRPPTSGGSTDGGLSAPVSSGGAVDADAAAGGAPSASEETSAPVLSVRCGVSTAAHSPRSGRTLGLCASLAVMSILRRKRAAKGTRSQSVRK
jgi:hypothetical protein